MEALSRKKCFNHALREAVARCPECERYFCRECVTEHDDRLLCSNCLQKRQTAASVTSERFTRLKRVLVFSVSFLMIWSFFYYLGQLLITLPVSFHDGTFLK